MDDDDYGALQSFLTAYPTTGSIIRRSGGIRKIRWRGKGRGKRGGIRVIYYWLSAEDRIYLLTLYGKGVKDDLTPGELAAWRQIVKDIEND